MEQCMTEAVPRNEEPLTIDKILEMAEKFKMPEITHMMIISQNMLDALNSKHDDPFFKIKSGDQVGTDVIKVSPMMHPQQGIRIPYCNARVAGINAKV